MSEGQRREVAEDRQTARTDRMEVMRDSAARRPGHGATVHLDGCDYAANQPAAGTFRRCSTGRGCLPLLVPDAGRSYARYCGQRGEDRESRADGRDGLPVSGIGSCDFRRRESASPDAGLAATTMVLMDSVARSRRDFSVRPSPTYVVTCIAPRRRQSSYGGSWRHVTEVTRNTRVLVSRCTVPRNERTGQVIAQRVANARQPGSGLGRHYFYTTWN